MTNIIELNTAKRRDDDVDSMRDDLNWVLQQLNVVAFAVSGLGHQCNRPDADDIVFSINDVIGRVGEMWSRLPEAN
jgi:hypothetical protein